ncbi:MAG TPA: tetratricopeptide repeat protein [Methylophilaceae bacterium]|nr:tetratricopeptide repeat protein [Methylophilaceae bacterium]
MPASRTLATLLLFLAAALASFSLQADELGEIARQVRNGQQATALERVNTYLKANPADVQAMFLKGVALSELNKREEAVHTFTQIIEKYPSLPEPYNNLAVLYAEQGQYDKARRVLEAALKTHPSYATAHANLANVYAYMASEAYDKAFQLDKSKGRPSASKLAMINDLSAPARPTLLAAKATPDSKNIIKEVVNPADALPPEPIKLSEPTKPAEPVKSATPEKPAAAEKPPTIQATEPAKIAQAPAPAQRDVSSSRADTEKTIKASVEAWALAWSSQNVEKYLASYAESFKTPNGESRKQWEETRRDRLTRPGTIKVDISGLRIVMENGDRARADFKQTYRAGNNVMRTNKTLLLKNSGGKWLIEQERTGS